MYMYMYMYVKETALKNPCIIMNFAWTLSALLHITFIN